MWKGGLKDGRGTVSAESGALASVPYNFAMRFESEKGTNPEELIAAAHAACFSMALSGQLGNAGTHTDCVRMHYGDFVDLANPTVGRFSRPRAES